ncbi:CYCXC family (seleno)protein [Alloacidobacterium sp.]|uniref:CYCXC family (seleno)protein n=1 Tax=Alloacidobacterium sp. TaxID=2951999 RepID=UPI002D60D36F|nr:CYCXC family (seleno)protein [Alloacidobacterium sp.]HYK37663.1 CYCXC family (seleno)protein [Alloacidobacterium sp.]
MNRILLGVAVGLVTIASYAQWSNPADDIPAYHPAPPAKAEKLPPILSGNQLQGEYFRLPWQRKVYEEAAQVPGVLYQLPCYCHCDRALGHTSLRSCFEGTHGAECTTCAKEGAYAYKMTKLGKSPREIREGIERKDYESIDLDQLGGM